MNREYRVLRKKYRLSSVKEMKEVSKRVTKKEVHATLLAEANSILAMPFWLYIETEILKASVSGNYERANSLNQLKKSKND
jgi:hypothetical protein